MSFGEEQNPLKKPAVEKPQRKLEFLPGDDFSPIEDLQPGDLIELTDDKNRTIICRAGQVMQEDFHHRGEGSKIDVRLVTDVTRVDGVDLSRTEPLTPGLFMEKVAKQKVVPLRQKGVSNPALNEGLRFKLTPWNLFPIAPSKIRVTPSSQD